MLCFVLVLYMGIALIVLDPPPSVKRANTEIIARNHHGKPLLKQQQQQQQQPLPPYRQCTYMETTYFKKGLR